MINHILSFGDLMDQHPHQTPRVKPLAVGERGDPLGQRQLSVASEQSTHGEQQCKTNKQNPERNYRCCYQISSPLSSASCCCRATAGSTGIHFSHIIKPGRFARDLTLRYGSQRLSCAPPSNAIRNKCARHHLSSRGGWRQLPHLDIDAVIGAGKANRHTDDVESLCHYARL